LNNEWFLLADFLYAMYFNFFFTGADRDSIFLVVFPLLYVFAGLFRTESALIGGKKRRLRWVTV
jgi:hypothetical protein